MNDADVELKHGAQKIVSFLRERGGVGEIDVAVNTNIACLNFLYENNIISEVGTPKKIQNKKWILHETVILAINHLIDYLVKYPDGAPIHVGSFSKNRGINTEFLGILLLNFAELGIISLTPGSNGHSPTYKLLVTDISVLRSIFEPKINFFAKNEEVAEDKEVYVDGLDHSACEVKLNRTLNDVVAAQDLAIRFGEEAQKAKMELKKTKEHNKALENANAELRQKLHAKEQEIKFIENSNDELFAKSQNNQIRLKEIQKSISV